MITLTHEIKLRGYELHDAGKHDVTLAKILKFPMPLCCEWDNGDIILKQAENAVIILN